MTEVDFQSAVSSYALRFFTPREIANLLCFPPHFSAFTYLLHHCLSSLHHHHQSSSSSSSQYFYCTHYSKAMGALHSTLVKIQLSNIERRTKLMKNRSERRKHCALAVVRRSQKFSPRHRPPSRGRRTAKI